MPAGRPKLQLDEKLIENLASIGCKNSEIAVIVGCSEATLCTNYLNVLEKGRANLKVSLRRWQIEAAKRGNIAMLIFLGKQILKQSNDPEPETGPNGEKVADLSWPEIRKILVSDKFVGSDGKRYDRDPETKKSSTVAVSGDYMLNGREGQLDPGIEDPRQLGEDRSDTHEG